MNRLWTRWIWILGVWAMAVACKAPEAPDFQGVRNMKVDVQGLSGARINGDAVFFNPNDRKITLKNVDVEISVEGKKVKDIAREFDITAEPNSEVTVPIDVTLTLQDLNMNLLSTAMSMLNGEEKKIRYKGKARVKMYGFSFNVPFDYEDDVTISL
uniref:LEA type 2 family protein n=1 Tax=Roseihalotalea indica TaxID=2867963 RepID=A0AA49GNY4_9BACT|nr:LEA type 2 family protein [Tunicatimonas sp. TK19036]